MSIEILISDSPHTYGMLYSNTMNVYYYEEKTNKPTPWCINHYDTLRIAEFSISQGKYHCNIMPNALPLSVRQSEFIRKVEDIMNSKKGELDELRKIQFDIICKRSDIICKELITNDSHQTAAQTPTEHRQENKQPDA